jgi:oligopeptide transport system ATP-binding protein
MPIRCVRTFVAESAATLEVMNLRKEFAVRGDAGPSRGERAVRSGLLGRRVRSASLVQKVVAVEDVSFAVESGQSLAIVGESGSGKTTVARMIVGLERPTGGRIFASGRERTGRHFASRERKRRAREIQIVFQDPYSSLDPRMSVRSCLEEVLKLHFDQSDSERNHRIDELVDQVGLDGRQAAALPRALSGGQRQRVAIARALASEPRLLICDEAVASLDVSIQAQVLNLLSDIRDATGVSFLFISHDLAVVRQVSDAVIVMKNGRIVESGPTAQVLGSPREPYTKRLLDAIPRPGWRPSASGVNEPTT